jgi:hypothetical protein
MFISLLLLLFVDGMDKLIRRMKIHAHGTNSTQIGIFYELLFTHPNDASQFFHPHLLGLCPNNVHLSPGVAALCCWY